MAGLGYFSPTSEWQAQPTTAYGQPQMMPAPVMHPAPAMTPATPTMPAPAQQTIVIPPPETKPPQAFEALKPVPPVEQPIIVQQEPINPCCGTITAVVCLTVLGMIGFLITVTITSYKVFGTDQSFCNDFVSIDFSYRLKF